MPQDSVVILSHPVALATKRWYLDERGTPKADDYGEGKNFTAEVVPVENLDELAGLLEVLATAPRSFVIRGEPRKGFDLSYIIRRAVAKGDEPATFAEVPRQWVMLDIDLKEKHDGDYTTPAGCGEVVEAIVARLPPELQRAGYFWQLSSSAGMKSAGLRAHLWFWLDRAMDCKQLTRWSEFVNDGAGKRVIDPHVFLTVQPNYTANPVFDGVVDPVAWRTGYSPGPPASLPRLLTGAQGWRRLLDPLYRANNEKIHDHVRGACASYFVTNGAAADDSALRKAVRAAVDAAESLQDRAGDYQDSRLEAEIESGRNFAREKAKGADQLLLDSRGFPKATIGNVLAIMQSAPEWQGMVAWNSRYLRIDIQRETPWGAKAGVWIDAKDSPSAAKWFAQQWKLGCEDGTIYRAAIAFAREAEYDPVQDWLRACREAWDGQKRLDTWMTAWCGVTDTPYARRVSRLFPLTMVARALDHGCQVDTALVIGGPTGYGKTSLMRVLGGEWYGPVRQEKDILQAIHGPWLVELPERGPFVTMHPNAMKSFLDQKFDRFRAPYMRDVEDHKRSCVIAITDNPDGVGWNTDATSARRYWPVMVHKKIQLDVIEKARAQLFGEAVAAFETGEQYWVDAGDLEFTTAQDTIYAHDSWQTSFAHILEEGGQGFTNGGMLRLPKNLQEVSIYDLITCVGCASPEKKEIQRAARAMLRIGWVHVGEGKWKRK